MDSNTKKYKFTYTLLLKYLFSIALMFLACNGAGNGKIFVSAFLELAVIWAFMETICTTRIRIVANGILLLLFNAQMLILWFGGDFISLVMLTNIDNLRDLSGKIIVYFLGITAVLLFSLYPTGRITNIKNKRVRAIPRRVLSLALFLELVFTMIFGNLFSPMFAYWRLGGEAREAARVRKELESMGDCTKNFYRQSIQGPCVDKPAGLGEKPNIVLILTEGLSENILKDDRSIMPNAAALEERSVSFKNYYNHTFATYRGIIGQLYSGYQLDNYDSNSLIGLQDILSDNGYNTSFINTEPKLVPFANYLSEMGFDEVVGDAAVGYSGPGGSMSDREAYELLFSEMENNNASGRPFFTAIYTFGTHASFDSPDQKFGDGKQSELNKFYNVDCWLGEFLQKFENSPCFDNTILVFTTDHATYADLYYNEAFPDYQRSHPSIDQIPLMIYHKGVEARTIDALGKNSLDLAPTILDYVDINGPNYFLGAFLFFEADDINSLDTIFTSSADYYSTRGCNIRKLDESDVETSIVQKLIQNYYAAKQQIPQKP